MVCWTSRGRFKRQAWVDADDDSGGMKVDTIVFMEL